MGSQSEFHVQPWQRFHVRVSLFNGIIVFSILLAMVLAFYEITYRAEFSALQERIRTSIAILSRRVVADRLTHLPPDDPHRDPYYHELVEDLRAICLEDPDITSIYVMARTDDPASLRFIVDVNDTSDGSGQTTVSDAPFNSIYPITPEVAQMAEGLITLTVEDATARDAWGESLSGFAPLRLSDGTNFGLIGVDVKASHLTAMKVRVLLVSLSLFAGAALILFLAALALGRRIRRPLAAINGAAERIAGGDFEADVAVERHDEFGLISNHFNIISRNLKERDFLRDTFGRYVSPDVARKVLQDRSSAALGGEERDVTVVFSDIEGYSSIAEAIPPQDVLRMLNTYLGAMNEVIDAHQGCIIEFLGDAILAVFNAPHDVADHASVAVRCGLAMQARLREVNREWAALPIAETWRAVGKSGLRARIGIHSGRAVAGNIGSKTRLKYGLIGDVVNVAARIEALNKVLQTSLLCSEATFRRLDPELAHQAVDYGAHVVKGRHNEVHVYGFSRNQDKLPIISESVEAET